jgi:solute carrier family 35 (UDP-galactose transporter), member B1
MLTFGQKLKLLGFAAGVLVTYTAFGILQEIIFRGRFGGEIAADGELGERFEMPISFRVLQCVFNTMFAKGSKVFDRLLL